MFVYTYTHTHITTTSSQEPDQGNTDTEEPQASPISKFDIDKQTKQKETPRATTIILGVSHSKFST
jgi:hypothetical protein